jgi:general secretion pathway protein E
MANSPSSAAGRGAGPDSETFAAELGRALLGRGLVDELGLRRAERAALTSGDRLDRVLSRLGLVPEAPLAEALAALAGWPYLAADQLPKVAVAEERLQLSFLRANHILPVRAEEGRLVVAMADPFNAEALGAMAYLLGCRIEGSVAAPGDIEKAIERLYGGEKGGAQIAVEAADGSAGASEEDIRRLEDMASEAPVIRLVQGLVTRAAEMGASDIHIEPGEDGMRVRYRIDGALTTIETLPLSARAAVTSRVKIMARMNIAERRLPQDGRIKANVRGREIDLRASTMPTLHGESVVLRILDRASVELDFSALGFGDGVREPFVGLLEEPHGIVLVTGPTGSGKTTTLYTGLGGLNRPDAKLFTVEDPIEYQLAGVNQIQVQPKIGLSFANALRSILRQDPDVIMIGEIRDLETAEIAVQSSLTGHLVLSTMHTNSAAGAITRLIDMGVEDFLLASSLTGVLGQRLVRCLCPHCKRPAERPPAVLARLAERRLVSVGETGAGLCEKVGCERCRGTGYAGRTVISELLVVDEAVRARILASSTEQDIEAAGIAGGMRTMLADGLAKALAGTTTIDEVLRVTRMG